jgi:hypothetical protein
MKLIQDVNSDLTLNSTFLDAGRNRLSQAARGLPSSINKKTTVTSASHTTEAQRENQKKFNSFTSEVFDLFP